MQCLISASVEGWPAMLTLNAANEWEASLLASMALCCAGNCECALAGNRLNITLEQPPAAEADAPTNGNTANPEPMPTPDESAADTTG